MLGDAVAAFARPDLEAARKLRDDRQGYDPDGFAQLGRQGWLWVSAPEHLNGADLGALGAVTVARPLGYGLRGEPFSQVVAASVVFGDATLSPRLNDVAGGVASGDVTPGVFLHHDATKPKPEAAAVSGGGYTLSGAAGPIEAGRADGFVLKAYDGSTPVLCWVPAYTPGVSIDMAHAPDGTQVAMLRFDQANVEADSVIATGDAASEISRRAFDAGVLAQSAELLGLMDRVLEITLEYLRTRKQFDRPIGAFQALQHRAVDVWVRKELAEAAVYAAATKFDLASTPSAQRSALCSAAKARASSSAMFVCNQAIQLHGAIGTTHEYELSLHLHRALRISTMFGASFFHRRRFSDYRAKAAVEAAVASADSERDRKSVV